MRLMQLHPMPAQRWRAATTRAPGGASSLLRLSAGAARVPGGASFVRGIGRAARALLHGSIVPTTVV
jgi:predicted ABC-type sugar transport system permease subunit